MSRGSFPFPRCVHVYCDRHGTLRTDFRRAGRRVPLPPLPLSALWWDAYRTAVAGDFAERTSWCDRRWSDTARHLRRRVCRLHGSASFRNGLAASTQAVHRNILARWRDQWGDRRLKDLQSRHEVDWLDEARRHAVGGAAVPVTG